MDQLLQYEPMSGDEDEVTDYSGSEGEEVDKHTFKQVHKGIGFTLFRHSSPSFRARKIQGVRIENHCAISMMNC